MDIGGYGTDFISLTGEEAIKTVVVFQQIQTFCVDLDKAVNSKLVIRPGDLISGNDLLTTTGNFIDAGQTEVDSRNELGLG